jgi:hypothetical protein
MGKPLESCLGLFGLSSLRCVGAGVEAAQPFGIFLFLKRRIYSPHSLVHLFPQRSALAAHDVRPF